MKDKWRFYKDTENKWRWQHTSLIDYIIGASKEGYTNKADCYGSARENGWTD